MRAREFFEATLPRLLTTGRFGEMSGLAFFDMDGEGGGQWWVDFAKRTVTATSIAGPLALLIRAQSPDFMAFVEGRMSADDGILTERLQVAGDAHVVAAFMRVSAHLSE